MCVCTDLYCCLFVQEGEVQKTVEVIILDDPFPEPNEIFFVYISEATGGARVASGSRDSWQKVMLKI